MAHEQNHINKYNNDDKKTPVVFIARTPEIEEKFDES